ncbi:S-layer protein [Candidatus Micrarchaeota archaeon]|nr:S-layer protein [Candidatus Micrarchaeota archaeon]
MKGLNVKRIAAIAAGAALLGASFAVADVTYLNKQLVNQNGQPVVKVVVGANAAASDGVAAANIAAIIGNLAYRSRTITATTQGDATCAVAAGSGSGTCPISNKKATLEVTVPGTVSGAHGFKTLISDFVDRDLENRNDSASGDRYTVCSTSTTTTCTPMTDTGARKISGSEFSPLATANPRDPYSGTTYTEEQRLWVQATTRFDNTLNVIVGQTPNAAYEIEFTHDSYGIPVCTNKDTASGTEGSNGDWSDCLSDNDETARHRTVIKYLGEDWIISGLTQPSAALASSTTSLNGGTVKLAKESAYGIIHIGESLNVTAGAYSVKLADITVPTGGSGGGTASASIEIYDANGVKLKEDQVAPSSTSVYSWTAPDGTKLKVKVYKTNPGYTLAAKWAEMAVYAQELELISGEKVDDANPNWMVTLYWKNRDYSTSTTDSTADTLRKIVLTNEAADNSLLKLQKGQSFDVITSPAKFQFNYDGITLGSADYNSVSFTLTTPTAGSFKVSPSANCNDYSTANGTLVYVSGPKDYFTVGSPTSYSAQKFYVHFATYDIAQTTPRIYYQPSGITSCYYDIGSAATNVAFEPGDGTQHVYFTNTSAAGGASGVGYINVTEDIGNNQAGYFWFKLNTSDTNSIKFEPKDKFWYSSQATQSGLLQTTATDYDTPFYTERGSLVSSISQDAVALSLAKKVAEAQYYVKSSGTASASATTVGPLAIGESASVSGGVVVKVADITETVGACTAAGAACTVDQTGVSAVLSTGGSSLSAVTIYPLDQNLVVMDSSTPSGVLISVGGPDVNSVTSAALQGGSVSFTAGTKLKQVFGDTIVVAGYSAADTEAAANELITELKAQRA